MRQGILVLVGVVLGFLLGGLGPRRDLENEREKVSRLQDELLKAERRARGGGLGRGVLPGLDGIFSSPGPSDEDPQEAVPEEDWEAEVGMEPGNDELVEAEQVPRSPGAELKEFDLAVDAQRLRAEQNRASLAEQADLSSAELEEFDRIVADMNLALAEHAEEVLAMVTSGEEPSPRQFLGISHDVTGIMLESQVAMEELVGEEDMGTSDDPEGQVWNYLDLETFRPAVQDAIEAGAAGPGLFGGEP